METPARNKTARSRVLSREDTIAMHEQLRAEAETHRTLEEVIQWGLTQSPPCPLVDVVVQDEFTHDVVLACSDVWLVYDTT